jgi:hypothetical protein
MVQFMKLRSEAKVNDAEEVSEIGTRLPGSPESRLTTRMVPKDRVFQRQQGCWNCMHFDNGATAESHIRGRRLMDMKALLNRGRTLEQAEQVLQSVGAMVKAPDFGVCLGGGAAAELVAATYLCSRWKGRITIEGKADVLVEEIYDKRGEKL